METRSLDLVLRPERLAIARLDAGDGLGGWGRAAFAGGGLAVVVRRDSELSVVCAEAVVPDEAVADHGWRAVEVQGPLDLALTGVLAAIAVPLADAGVPIFALSTYDTDLLLVREEHVAVAAGALERAGHRTIGFASPTDGGPAPAG